MAVRIEHTGWKVSLFKIRFKLLDNGGAHSGWKVSLFKIGYKLYGTMEVRIEHSGWKASLFQIRFKLWGNGDTHRAQRLKGFVNSNQSILDFVILYGALWRNAKYKLVLLLQYM